MATLHKERPRILFVDDDGFVLAGLARMLSPRHGEWDLEFADSAEAAINRYAPDSFDVVVSDMKMPGMNGLDLVMTMRQGGSTAEFIILTGHADLNMAVNAINRAGVFRFFTKPCPRPRLLEGIEAALAAHAVTVPRRAAKNAPGGDPEDASDEPASAEIDSARPLFPGLWVLQIGNGIDGVFETEDALNDAPEALAARATGRTVVVYGPDGLRR